MTTMVISVLIALKFTVPIFLSPISRVIVSLPAGHSMKSFKEALIKLLLTHPSNSLPYRHKHSSRPMYFSSEIFHFSSFLLFPIPSTSSPSFLELEIAT